MSMLQSERTLFDAAIESARIFNNAVAECAVAGGLLTAAPQFVSTAELTTRLKIHEEKAEPFQALLDVLVDLQLLERRVHNGVAVYRTNQANLIVRSTMNGTLSRYHSREEIIRPWFGEGHVDLIRSSNMSLIGDNLSFFRRPSVKIRFDRSFLDVWRTNLANPLYEFGRMVAVREMVARGTVFLDLASGLGYGAQRIAEYVTRESTIVCVDNSRDFLDQAKLLIYPRARLRWIHADLNLGLPNLPEAPFDGVLFNGAFHFIQDKRAQLRQIFEVTRPGGLLVIGHCFCRNAFLDESMHDLYFSMIANKSWPMSLDELKTMMVDEGFKPRCEFHRGSHSFVLADRLDKAVSRS